MTVVPYEERTALAEERLPHRRPILAALGEALAEARQRPFAADEVKKELKRVAEEGDGRTRTALVSAMEAALQAQVGAGMDKDAYYYAWRDYIFHPERTVGGHRRHLLDLACNGGRKMITPHERLADCQRWLENLRRLWAGNPRATTYEAYACAPAPLLTFLGY
jgi:hypothetical protein